MAVARARHRQPRVRAAVRQVAGHGVAGGTWAPGARRGAVTAGGRAVLRRERPGTDEARIAFGHALHRRPDRSEEHTSELQSLMRISYAVFCLKKQTHENKTTTTLSYNIRTKHQ